jgi:ribonuclease D
MSDAGTDDIQVLIGDLSNLQANLLVAAGTVACDIETTGLDWKQNRIASCQLYFPGGPVFIVRTKTGVPSEVCRVLSNQKVRKVFHHAMFDLRFINHHWSIAPTNVACTRIAARLVDRENRRSHSLKDILEQYLGVSVSKAEQTSDWMRETLTEAQVRYAAADVRYLIPLLDALDKHLRSLQLDDLALRCFEHVPARVRLEVLGYDDVYGYSSRGQTPPSLLRKLLGLLGRP